MRYEYFRIWQLRAFPVLFYVLMNLRISKPPDCLVVVGGGVTRRAANRRSTAQAPSSVLYPFQKRPHCLKLWIYSQQNKCFWKRHNVEIFTVLGFCTAQNRSFVSFRNSLSLPFSKVKQSRRYDSDCLTLTNGTDRLSRNVGTKLWFYNA
jgi:hypothetical protein